MHRHLMIVALAFTGFAASASTAETITVCASGCDHTSINAALDAADDGDVIQLSAETYTEGETIVVDHRFYDITIRGTVDSDGNPTSILSGEGMRQVMRCASYGDCRFENLVIAHGFLADPGNMGAGLMIGDMDEWDPNLVQGSWDALTRVHNCVFRDNTGVIQNPAGSPTEGGAGLALRFRGAVLTSCEFSSNTGGGLGGGSIIFLRDAYLTMRGCRLTGNTIDPSFWPRGVISATSGALRLIGCEINCNTLPHGIEPLYSLTLIEDECNLLSGSCVEHAPDDSDGDGIPDDCDGIFRTHLTASPEPSRLASAEAQPGTDLSNLDLSHADLAYTDLAQANLANTTLYAASLVGANLTGCDLSDADLQYARGIRITGVPTLPPTWSIANGALLGPTAELDFVDLAGTNLAGANLTDASFFKSDLSGCDLSDAELIWAYLTEASLDDADLSRANLFGARLDSASLRNAVLRSSNLNWAGFLGNDLTNADFSHANLTNTTLASTGLHPLVICNARFFGTDLSQLRCEPPYDPPWYGVSCPDDWCDAFYDHCTILPPYVKDPVAANLSFMRECPGDVSCDGVVDAGDIGLLVAAWGTDESASDINADGDVDGGDLAYILGYWGPCLPR